MSAGWGGTVTGHRVGALEGDGGLPPPPHLPMHPWGGGPSGFTSIRGTKILYSEQSVHSLVDLVSYGLLQCTSQWEPSPLRILNDVCVELGKGGEEPH